jgi:hypothetical protein
MEYNDFLNRVINEGIEAATADYREERQKPHLEGSIAGFEACRNKNPFELLDVWKESQEYAQKSFNDRDDPDKYWWFRCYQLEVEWVCNVVSAVLYNEGKPPILSWLPTCNGMSKAASIIGVAV